jgi:hypothetical protein
MFAGKLQTSRQMFKLLAFHDTLNNNNKKNAFAVFEKIHKRKVSIGYFKQFYGC